MRSSWKVPAATVAMTIAALLSAHAASAQQAARKPNILVIFGDDIGQSNISAYGRGVMGFT